MRRYFRVVATWGVGLGLLLFQTAAAQQSVVAEKYVVVTGHPDATNAALTMLEHGGSVMDAAVTASLCVGVAEPYGSGLGGKLMLLYRDGKTGEVSAVEAMCAASRALDSAKFAKLRARERYFGYSSVGVPGLVAGLHAAHVKWGTKPWQEVVLPAAELAERGVTIDEKSRRFYRAKTRQLQRDPETARLYLVDGETPDVGDVLHNADLGRSLRRIADGGAAAFYEGAIAERIVAAATAAGAPLTLDDFRDYKPRWSQPLVINYHGYKVYSCPPPLTGGVTVLTSLRALEHLDPLGARATRSSHYIDQLGRVLLAVYPPVTAEIADSPGSFAAAAKLLGAETARQIAVQSRAVDPTNPYGEGAPAGVGEAAGDDRPDASTTHLTIADADGNIVCLTQSLSYHFGACTIVPGTGFLLNDSMSNFSTRDPEGVNYARPGQRERSTIAPIIATREGKPVLALGIPGGQRIPTTTLQLVVDILADDVPLVEAFDRSRFHVRRPIGDDEAPNIVDLEEDAPQQLDQELQELGWKTVRMRRNGSYFGGGNGVMYRADGKLEGVADLRRTNFAAGK
ncbi:MAG: gamma-glutamyltransferase family protein [Pirellulales bacterium]